MYYAYLTEFHSILVIILLILSWFFSLEWCFFLLSWNVLAALWTNLTWIHFLYNKVFCFYLILNSAVAANFSVFINLLFMNLYSFPSYFSLAMCSITTVFLLAPCSFSFLLYNSMICLLIFHAPNFKWRMQWCFFSLTWDVLTTVKTNLNPFKLLNWAPPFSFVWLAWNFIFASSFIHCLLGRLQKIKFWVEWTHTLATIFQYCSGPCLRLKQFDNFYHCKLVKGLPTSSSIFFLCQSQILNE
jgi:hypothetical protein